MGYLHLALWSDVRFTCPTQLWVTTVTVAPPALVAVDLSLPAGGVAVAIAVFLIGFAKDIRHHLGDTLEQHTKPRAVTIFVFGFCVLDVANNMLQGPCRAFLADLSNGHHNTMRIANEFYSFFMVVGNVLGYAAGSYAGLYKIFPFTTTQACDTT